MSDVNEQTEVIIPAPKSETQEESTTVVVPQRDAEDTTQKTNVTGTASQPENAKPTKEELDRRAEQGKISALEREKNQSIAQRDAILRHMNPIFESDPEAYERWRRGITSDGIQDPGSHAELYGTKYAQPAAQPQQGYVQPQSYQQPEQPVYNPLQDPRYIEQLVDRRSEDRDGFKEFVKEVPEMDPANLQTEEDRATAKTKWEKLSWFATVYKAQFPGISSGEAFKMAYRALPENLNKSYEQGRQVGELTGRQSAYTAGVGNSSISSAKPSTGGGSLAVKMTNAQRERYEFLKTKDPTGSLAQHYAENVSKQ